MPATWAPKADARCLAGPPRHAGPDVDPGWPDLRSRVWASSRSTASLSQRSCLLRDGTVSQARGVHLVVVDSDARPGPRRHTDKVYGARQPVRHLLALGRRTVWHVAGPRRRSRRPAASWRGAGRSRPAVRLCRNTARRLVGGALLTGPTALGPGAVTARPFSSPTTGWRSAGCAHRTSTASRYLQTLVLSARVSR
jgi:hypothetical protein